MRNLTIVATIILPLNLVTGSWFIVHSISPCRMVHRLMFSRGFEGLWGMNMPVPFQTGTSRDIGKCPIITKRGDQNQSQLHGHMVVMQAMDHSSFSAAFLSSVSRFARLMQHASSWVRSPGYHAF